MLGGRIARSLYRQVEALVKRYELIMSEGEKMRSSVNGYPGFLFRWNRSLIFFAVALASRRTRPALEPFWQITASTAFEPAE